MKKSLTISFFAALMFLSCKNDDKILNSLNDFNIEMESKGYHFGDQLTLPEEVTKNTKNISITFGDKETNQLVVDPKYFSLGDNAVTFVLTKSNGDVLYQDATINVFAKNVEKSYQWKIVKEYPHDTKSFTQGFQLEGNIIYESDGQNGSSRIWKYNLGTIDPIASTPQPYEVFSEGATIVGDKVYQLSWQNKKGFIYDKSSLKLLKEFQYPNILGEGWGLTYDGKNLIVSDGSKNVYFLNVDNPSTVERQISIAGNTQAYDMINELEYHKGFIYANVWQKPIVLKIDPKTGEVVGKFDFTAIAVKHTTNNDDVLNGIAFKDDNLLITGKYWPTIYEIKVK